MEKLVLLQNLVLGVGLRLQSKARRVYVFFATPRTPANSNTELGRTILIDGKSEFRTLIDKIIEKRKAA